MTLLETFKKVLETKEGLSPRQVDDLFYKQNYEDKGFNEEQIIDVEDNFLNKLEECLHCWGQGFESEDDEHGSWLSEHHCGCCEGRGWHEGKFNYLAHDMQGI